MARIRRGRASFGAVPFSTASGSSLRWVPLLDGRRRRLLSASLSPEPWARCPRRRTISVDASCRAASRPWPSVLCAKVSDALLVEALSAVGDPPVPLHQQRAHSSAATVRTEPMARRRCGRVKRGLRPDPWRRVRVLRPVRGPQRGPGGARSAPMVSRETGPRFITRRGLGELRAPGPW